MPFDAFNLSPKILDAVTDLGISEPTPIQKNAIPAILNKKDVIGIAQTGSGKTAAFVLPMLQHLEKGRARTRMPRSLILEPTRELASQIYDAFTSFGKNYNLTLALLIGGISFEQQFEKLERGADVLIATPGRLLDHYEKGKLILNKIEILVIDEADRMLDMGFIPDIEKIKKLLNPKKQTLLFSATMPDEIQKLAQNFLNNPEKIEVYTKQKGQASDTIEQFAVRTESDQKIKRQNLRDVIKKIKGEITNAIIFANRKVDVDILEKSMAKHRINAAALHGDMNQHTRLRTLDNFKNGEVTFLIASDVAARGLDIPDVSHVFNYDLPTQAEDYIHRIGRTGRAGKKGKAISMITQQEAKYFNAIQKITHNAIQWIGEPIDADNGERVRDSKAKSKPNKQNQPKNSRSKPKKHTPSGAASAGHKQPISDDKGHMPAFLFKSGK